MKLDRRFLLRGTCQGAAALMAMPFLDCFLDGKGQALAATGQRLPTRFNTFFYGLGHLVILQRFLYLGFGIIFYAEFLAHFGFTLAVFAVALGAILGPQFLGFRGAG